MGFNIPKLVTNVMRTDAHVQERGILQGLEYVEVFPGESGRGARHEIDREVKTAKRRRPVGFRVSENDIKSSIENYTPTNNRSQIIVKGTNKIILDAYNANPSSMQAALENFNQLKGSNKIVFLGDMFELGKDSLAEHQEIAELATSYNFNNVYLIGKAFSTTSVKNAFVFKSFDSFKDSNKSINFNNATILIKGSRGMALERILDLF